MRVENVSYRINWSAFKTGASIFIPCLNPKTALVEINKVIKRLRYKVVTRIVIEDGVQGVRIWRV
jgi:hypothetical protein